MAKVWIIFLVLLYLQNVNGTEEKCRYCERTFKTLSKHIWRCSKKITQAAHTDTGNHGNDFVQIETQDLSIANVNNESSNDPPEGLLTEYDERSRKKDNYFIKCHCGKLCNGNRGLRAHQRFCHINDTPELKDLFTCEIEQLENNNTNSNDVISNRIKKLPKKGIKLPKSTEEWRIANDFFRLHLECNEINDVDAVIQNVQNTIYDYFASNYGTIDDVTDDLKQQYQHRSIRQLKKELKRLKGENNELNNRTIRYISKLIRAKYSKAQKDELYRDHDAEIKNNFWQYCKKTFEPPKDNTKPNFDENTCYNYFQNASRKNTKENNNFPKWMKMLDEPTDVFNEDPPSYREITKIVNKMKSGGSPCPYDHISIIVLKRCPYLRTLIHHILVHCWNNRIFPEEWKYAFTILIYKRDCNKDPKNFRPITLQPILAKVYSSFIRNRMYTYLVKNKFIETNLQKGFWSEISGCIEHTELLTYVINHARLKQRQVIITLLDLKNAFGEIDHEIILKILDYHHFPESIKDLIKSYYTNYNISIGTETFTTNPILIEKGVLQGDCLSPLLFNLVVNALLKTIDTEKIRSMGYRYSESLQPRHWFQFADDSALITSTEEDSQALLNVFSKWCYWAGLKICPRKCKTFAMKKNGTKTVQFHPYLRVNNVQIPTLADGESFKYLGKEFTMHMNPEKEENQLKSDLREYVENIHRTPLHPKNKIAVITRYIYSKIRWRLSTNSFSFTWVKQNLDSIVIEYVKRWLNLHQGANTRHLFLPIGKLGIEFSLPSDIFKACQLVKRSILKSSKNQEIQELYKLSMKKHIEEERLLQNNDKKSASRIMRKEATQRIIDDMSGLKEQNTILQTIRNMCTAKAINMWHRMTENMPANIYKFTRKALIFSLPINVNLKRWNRLESELCPLCNRKQTQLHVLNHCSTAINDGRFAWRHNSVLFTILHYVNQLSDKGFEIYADLPGFKNPNELFNRLRPDIVLKKGSEFFAIELTCCFETNIVKSNNYKKNRYLHLADDMLIKQKLTKFYVEVTSMGFVPKENDLFYKFLKKQDINTERLISKVGETALRCSYYLYTQRNKGWEEKEILKFY